MAVLGWNDLYNTNESFTFPRENPNNSRLAQGNDDAMMIAMASSVWSERQIAWTSFSPLLFFKRDGAFDHKYQ